MERIRDLLDPFKTKTNLQVARMSVLSCALESGCLCLIGALLPSLHVDTTPQAREDARGQVYIGGVTEIYVTSEAELLALMLEGQKNRWVGCGGGGGGLCVVDERESVYGNIIACAPVSISNLSFLPSTHTPAHPHTGPWPPPG